MLQVDPIDRNSAIVPNRTSPLTLEVYDSAVLRLGLSGDLIEPRLPADGNLAQLTVDQYHGLLETCNGKVHLSPHFEGAAFAELRQFIILSARTMSLLDYQVVQNGAETTLANLLNFIANPEAKVATRQWLNDGRLCDPVFYDAIILGLGKDGLSEVQAIGAELAPAMASRGLLAPKG